MKHHRPVRRPGLAPLRALMAFGATVVLALIAVAALLWPDSARDMADALAMGRDSLENWLPASLSH